MPWRYTLKSIPILLKQSLF
uniref:Uncharacterized protein n=1 Tax=Lepeophtheirus salmonis TaxID=72036 RepID=A0A0K2UF90_LEPSM